MLPDNLTEQAAVHGQEHLIEMAQRLLPHQHESFIAQLSELDFAVLKELFNQTKRQEAFLDINKSKSPPIVRLPVSEFDLQREKAAKRTGEVALRQGRIAIIMVAGGQGTRLGHDAPKGTYPIGPVSARSLFQIHAEKVLALSRRYQVDIPLLIMTSQENDQATQNFFQEHHWFGLKQDQVTFFVQGMLPALDSTTGQVLLKATGELALSPNGHGGVIQSLHQTGILDRMAQLGITDCYYFQVDNPLVKIVDPTFVGHHLASNAEMSLKVLAKLYPTERMGNLVELEGRCRIIEYTELPNELAHERMPDGELRIWAGSPAIHLFNLPFLQRLGRGEISLPYHIAHKAVPFLNRQGELIKPEKPNAFKFERFVFDALPLAERVVAVETSRAEEFEPLKNATGENSAESVRQALSDQYASWLKQAGLSIPDSGYVEISPLDAMQAEDVTRQTKYLSTSF